MNSCDFKEIIVFKDFEVKNGVLGLEWDVYLSIVKFLDSSILRKVCVNIYLRTSIHCTEIINEYHFLRTSHSLLNIWTKMNFIQRPLLHNKRVISH
jgi:hypothetical protein